MSYVLDCKTEVVSITRKIDKPPVLNIEMTTDYAGIWFPIEVTDQIADLIEAALTSIKKASEEVKETLIKKGMSTR